MKILVCLHDYLPLHKGGSEIHAHQTARELVRRGHDVTALFTERDLEAEAFQVREGVLDGVRTREVVHQREYADVRETYLQEPSLAAFEAEIARLRPDVVHVHHFAIWGSRILPAIKRAGARLIVTLHDYFATCDNATLLRADEEICDGATCTHCLAGHPLLPERWPADWPEQGEAALARIASERRERHRADLASADVVISPSAFARDLFVQGGFVEAERCVVMKAGYPGPKGEARRFAGDRALRVGYVGGIYPSKGLHVLTEAFASLAADEAQLHVHGHLDWFPDYVERLRASVDARDAEAAPVHFHGPFDPSKLDDVLQGIDVLVVPSIWYENMPITIQEAFRNGIPVVTTDLGGMREAVTDGVSGLTFPRGDAGALAGCLRRLAREPGLYDRLAAGRPEVPTLEAIVDGLERLYRDEG